MSYNSTIKQKTGICIDCETKGNYTIQNIIGKPPRCQYHYKIYRAAINGQKTHKGHPLPKYTHYNQDNGLTAWFKMVATFIRSNPHCWECGSFIPENLYKFASAHILPKAIFKSVATHPFNFIILNTPCGCHHRFDSSIDKACEMKVWAKAVERFKIFEPEIRETHKHLDLFKSKIIV